MSVSIGAGSGAMAEAREIHVGVGAGAAAAVLEGWIGVGGGTDYAAVMAVHPYAGQPHLWLGGGPNTAGTAGAHGILLWDGTSYGVVGSGNGIDTRPGAPVVHDDGSGPALYVPGSFWNSAGGLAMAQHGTARWNGSTWSQVGAPT